MSSAICRSTSSNSTLNWKAAGPSTPPQEVNPLDNTAPLRPSSRHWTSKVREQPLTTNPLSTSSPAEGELTITSESGRVGLRSTGCPSSHVRSRLPSSAVSHRSTGSLEGAAPPAPIGCPVLRYLTAQLVAREEQRFQVGKSALRWDLAAKFVVRDTDSSSWRGCPALVVSRRSTGSHRSPTDAGWQGSPSRAVSPRSTRCP